MWCDEFLEEVAVVTWNDIGRVHDWRNYVPMKLQGIFHKLSFEARVVIYITAEAQADQEDWD